MSDDKALSRIEGKLDSASSKIDTVDNKVTKLEVYVEKNTKDLEDHMMRTDLNEQRIYRLEKVEQWLRGATWITIGLGALVISVFRLIK